MDKSKHIDASDLAEMAIKEISAAQSEDEDSYTEEGVNLGLRIAVQKIEAICKREDVPIFVLTRH